MSGAYKCPQCGQHIKKDEEYIVSNKRRYHAKCFDNINKEKNDYKNLMSYIKNLFNDKVNYGMVGRQIKEYVEKYSMTYEDIQYCLYYYFEVKKNNISTNTIGIVPYIYAEALAHKKKNEKINQNISNTNFNIQYEEKNIKIKVPQRKPLIQIKPIDLDNI